MMRMWLRGLVVGLIGAVVLGVVPSAASADPTTPEVPKDCSGATVADLNSQVKALNLAIANHNSQPVDQTNAGAVAQYNARAEQLESQRAALNARIEACRKAAENPPAQETAPAPNNPTQAALPPTDGQTASRGSGPWFIWVAMGSGTLADEDGYVSPDQAARAAEGYGIPDTVVRPNAFHPYRGRMLDDLLAEYADKATGRWKWLPEHGFRVSRTSPKFSDIDTVDGFLGTDPDSGLFPAGTPYEERALPPGTLGPYVKLIGTGKKLPRNLALHYGPVLEAFGMKGGAFKQLVVDTVTDQAVSIERLIAEGYLKKAP